MVSFKMIPKQLLSYKNKIHLSVLIISATLALFAPLLTESKIVKHAENSGFPGWPATYESKKLTQLPLTKREIRFTENFPGKIARFSDGQREIIIRWVSEPTRMLHPASDCFKGIGYNVTPLPVQLNQANIKMGCFSADKGEQSLSVCEYIEDASSRTWSDISSWYWSAIWEEKEQGWMSFVVAEKSGQRHHSQT